MPRKIDINPLLQFTCDEILYIITEEQKKASGAVHSNARGKMHRRVNASDTPCHCSVPALNERGECFMDMRELKGLGIAARSRINFKNGVWLVPSQSSARTYNVILNSGAESCNCEDFTLHNLPCKHIHAARLARERDHGDKAPGMDTDVIPKRKTYRQNWPAYNEAQFTEKKRLQVLLADLCRGIPTPPRPPGKVGRTPISLGDQAFACAFKVYSTFSGRRFNCGLQDAIEKGHMACTTMAVNKLCCYMENEELTPVLHKLIVQSSLPLRAIETNFAPDSTGFSTSRFVRWNDEKYGVQRSDKDLVKAHVMTGVKTNIVTAVIIEGRDANDSPMFKPLVEATAENFNVQEVSADKAYLSRENLELLNTMGGAAYIPFKSNSIPGEVGSLWERLFHYYQFRREDFLKHYHQRSNAESTFSMVKAKFRDHVRSKTDVAMKNEVLCKLLCHNICVLIQSQCELGIEPMFWKGEEVNGDRDVLPLNRPG